MEFTITKEEQNILLAQARESISAKLEGRDPLWQGDISADSNLNVPCGAFVTLHMLPGRSLRGCIGRMTANLPLIETVRTMAKEAAFHDPRFPSIKKEEIKFCHIEISALSPMTSCADPQKVKVGVHGLYLTGRGRSGVLLPQVPVEQGWDLDEYLDYICLKAGLPSGYCYMPDAELFTFTAVVFGEE